MAVRKVGFVGIRTERLAEMVALFRDILGFPVARQEGDLMSFELADGTILELFGPGDEFHTFFKTGPVVGFQVENFDEARRALIAAGVPFIGEVQRPGGVAWQHFCCPDGVILEIIGPAG
jgi:catechol 2,3-dioxygenase-like lactoylglutathione lyase family enzyme